MRLRRQMLWGLGLAGSLLLASWLHAKPGMVRTLDHQTIEGDIDDSTPGRIIVTSKNGIRTTIDRRSIESITLFDTPAKEFEARLSALSPSDVAGRIALAKWAVGIKQYGLAREAIASALRIDPANKDAAALTAEVNKLNPLPATRAATTAGPTTKPAIARREVTPEEMNYIRQQEWQPTETVRVRVPADVRQKFIQSGLLPRAEAGKLNMFQLALAIRDRGTPEMRQAVEVLSDPRSMQVFHQQVQKILATGCATCHEPAKAAGGFVLFPGESDAATYSNFLILQRTTENVKGVEYSLVDRNTPQRSLLLQYLLPPDLAAIPHPKVAGYKGAVKNVADPRYAQILSWIRSLPIIAPNYDAIDLTKAAPAAERPSARTK